MSTSLATRPTVSPHNSCIT
ncbi:unnamed protein product [Medioppia subpectinata]|uniref:Uncharacterized protein n=1 Tax=Medioppia subpectinata TaxID=1979941 RepID=A0A7R9L687_9ACAR|nr:unnamed protein product [Medioppia subpectinata]CAG2116158.1 unnamed protein product [Medioppia subpectinata]